MRSQATCWHSEHRCWSLRTAWSKCRGFFCWCRSWNRSRCSSFATLNHHFTKDVTFPSLSSQSANEHRACGCTGRGQKKKEPTSKRKHKHREKEKTNQDTANDFNSLQQCCSVQEPLSNYCVCCKALKALPIRLCVPKCQTKTQQSVWSLLLLHRRRWRSCLPNEYARPRE